MFGLFKKSSQGSPLILPFEKQVKAWRTASRKMKWEIPPSEFDKTVKPPPLTDEDRQVGFSGSVLCYGFGSDGTGHSDAVLSGKLAWDYAIQKWDLKVWQCRHIDFDKPENIRLWPDAPKRPTGFYWVKFKPGKTKHNQTVAAFRKAKHGSTGCGPEGIQLLTVTHSHLRHLMNQRKLAFMAFADYDVAPHGFFDFYDAVQMFCSNNTLGLGIGNVDQNYPMFAISEIQL